MRYRSGISKYREVLKDGDVVAIIQRRGSLGVWRDLSLTGAALVEDSGVKSRAKSGPRRRERLKRVSRDQRCINKQRTNHMRGNHRLRIPVCQKCKRDVDLSHTPHYRVHTVRVHITTSYGVRIKLDTIQDLCHGIKHCHVLP